MSVDLQGSQTHSDVYDELASGERRIGGQVQAIGGGDSEDEEKSNSEPFINGPQFVVPEGTAATTWLFLLLSAAIFTAFHRARVGPARH